MKKKSLILFRAIKMGLSCLWLTPLLFWNDLLFPFETTKSFFIVAMTEVLFLLFAWFIYFEPTFRPKLSHIGKVFTAFIIIVLLTSLLGIDPVYSFWGDVDRLTGGFILLHLFLLFLIFASIFRRKQDWIQFFTCAIAISFIVSFFHILSILGLYDLTFNRSGSTFGNSTNFAVYLAFHAFFSTYLMLNSKDIFVKMYGFFGTLLNTLTLFTIGALAVKISFIGGVFLFLFLVFIGRSPVKWKHKIGWPIFGIFVFSCLTMTIIALTPGSSVQNILIRASSPSRFVVWNISWQGIKERPWFGWGLENFNSVYPKYYKGCLDKIGCNHEIMFDRAHNKVIDVFIESGLIGLLLYFAIFFVIFFQIWKKKIRDELIYEPAIIISVLAIYFVQSLVNPEAVFTLYLLVVLFAFSNFLCSLFDQDNNTSTIYHKSTISPLLVTILFPVFFSLFVIQPIRGIQATYLSVSKNNIDQKVLVRAMSLSPIGRDFRRVYLSMNRLKRSWMQPGGKNFELSNTQKEEIYLSESFLNQTLLDRPNEFRTLLAQGMLYQFFGRHIQPEYYQKSEVLIKKTIAISPQNPQSLWSLASLYIELGKYKEAFELTQTALKLNPTYPLGYRNDLIARKYINDKSKFETEAIALSQRFPGLIKDIQILLQADKELDRNALIYALHLSY